MSDIPIANRLSIRECGLDEYWLQNQIYENPNCLGLGELESVAKERQQSGGGRLDLKIRSREAGSANSVAAESGLCSCC